MTNDFSKCLVAFSLVLMSSGCAPILRDLENADRDVVLSQLKKLNDHSSANDVVTGAENSKQKKIIDALPNPQLSQPSVLQGLTCTPVPARSGLRVLFGLAQVELQRSSATQKFPYRLNEGDTQVSIDDGAEPVVYDVVIESDGSITLKAFDKTATEKRGWPIVLNGNHQPDPHRVLVK